MAKKKAIEKIKNRKLKQEKQAKSEQNFFCFPKKKKNSSFLSTILKKKKSKHCRAREKEAN